MAETEQTLKMPPSFRLAAFDSLDSTSTELIRQLQTDPELNENLVVWAKTQNKGRGRRNRDWVSQSGNLFFSILKRPKRPLPEWAQSSFTVSLGIHCALEEVILKSDVKIECKWPNDVLVNGAKICGILLETHNIQKPDEAALIVGVGVNVKSHPDPVLYPATSIEKVLGQNFQSNEILEITLRHINLWFKRWEEEGFHTIRDEWLKRAKGIGQEITVHLENAEISGTFDGLDDQGALIINTPYGSKTISAGDVFFNN